MPDPDRYAAAQAAMLRDDWQFSRVFSGTAQAGFTALLGLRAELQQLLAQINEPAIAAMKLEWWRNEVARGFQGEAQHPLAKALGNHLAAAGVAAEYCIEIIDAAEMESEAFEGFTEQNFRLYLYRSSGVLAEQLVQLHGDNDRHALNAARKLAETKRCSDLVLATGTMLRAGVWLFPAQWLNGTDSGALLKNPQGEAARSLIQQMRTELDAMRINARTAMEGAALPPAMALQWSLAQRDYMKLHRNPESIFSAAPPKDSPTMRLWTAWRGARNALKTNNRKH